MPARFEICTAVSTEVVLGCDEVFVGVKGLGFKDVCYVCIKGSLFFFLTQKIDCLYSSQYGIDVYSNNCEIVSPTHAKTARKIFS